MAQPDESIDIDGGETQDLRSEPALEIPPAAGPGGAPGSAQDDVNTGRPVEAEVVYERPSRRRRGEKKDLGVGLVRHNQGKKVKAMGTCNEVKRLVCEENMSITTAARHLGISRVTASKAWNVWVRRTARLMDDSDPETQKHLLEVRTHVEHNVRALIERCMKNLDESPGYAAGAIRGIEVLCKMSGINLDAGSGDKSSEPGGPASILDAAKAAAGGQLVGLAVAAQRAAEVVEAEPVKSFTGLAKLPAALRKEFKDAPWGDV